MLEALIASLMSTILTSKYFFYVLAITFVFWIFWVNLNVLHNRMEKRRGIKKFLIACVFWPLLIVGGLIDVIYNKTLGTVLFWEWGCETTLSMRMTRYLAGRTCDKLGHADYGYRVPVARWISTYLVEPWAQGHIGIEKFGYPPAKNLIDAFVKRYKKFLP